LINYMHLENLKR